MSYETLFRILIAVIFILSFSIAFTFRHRAEKKAGQLRSKEGLGIVRVMRLFSLIIWGFIFAYVVNPEWVAWVQLPLPMWLRGVGAALLLLAIPLIYWVYISLGLNVSPTQSTREGATLVTHGPYRWVRHPLYTVGTMAYLGIGLVTALWPVSVGMLAFMSFLVLRTPKEEARLIETFGETYRQYMARTGRYVPRLW
ncbi:MAG: isoprenylcysteine carboxylmethyltransferase family protein [Chloroflexi bacterium]|nr:isoprenylcysteine carboxylmethyltransferase family protein [Chloroflexota bacterium]